MSLFGGRSSSSSTTTQNITNQNVGASEGSLVANEGSTINVLDGGAIEKAFDFGGDALRGFSDLANLSIDASTRFARESLGLVERQVSASQKSFEGALAATLGKADDAQSGGAQRLLWLAGLALAAMLVLARR